MRRFLFVIYDNDSYVNTFPLGPAYLMSVLKQHGYDVKVFNQDVYHYPDEVLTNYLDKNHFDYVGIGVIGGYYQYRKLVSLSNAVNKSKDRPVFIVGGHGPSPEPEYFLRKTGADFVVIGEAERSLPNLLYALENNNLNSVKGIAFLTDSQFVQTPREALIKNLDDLPFPAWDSFPMEHYVLLREANIKKNQRCMQVLSGRGCLYKCNFCYRMDSGYRPRSIESVVEEIRTLQRKFEVNYIAFYDELIMTTPQRTIDLSEAILKAKLNISWNCNGRLNVAAKHPEVLDAMKKAGCVFINYGIECLNDDCLAIMNKCQTVDEIIHGIENTLNKGISPGFNIIFGNIGESLETLKAGVEFLKKYDDHSQLRTIRPVTPYPGSPLYYDALEKGLLAGPEDFYEVKHTNSDLLTVNFTNLSDDEFYEALYKANYELLLNYENFKSKQTKQLLDKLYKNKDVAFRGFRQI